MLCYHNAVSTAFNPYNVVHQQRIMIAATFIKLIVTQVRFVPCSGVTRVSTMQIFHQHVLCAWIRNCSRLFHGACCPKTDKINMHIKYTLPGKM